MTRLRAEALQRAGTNEHECFYKPFLFCFVTNQVKHSQKSRHPGGSQGPVVLQHHEKTGFRLSPE
jgi:hypothetical protein